MAVVVDDLHLAAVWLRKLTRSGCEFVGVYASAEAAWQALRHSPPAAILPNWELPPGPNGDWLPKHFTQHQLPTRISGTMPRCARQRGGP